METLHPGHYLQEVKADRPVEGVSTSTGAFAGIASKGQVGKSKLVTSWNQFVDAFGGYSDNSYLAYSVRGFFENGGSRAFISRVVHFDDKGVKTSSPATAEIKTGTDIYILVDALFDGTAGDSLEVEIKNFKEETGVLDFIVFEGSVAKEQFTGVKLVELEDVVNYQSKLIKVTVVDDEATLPVGKTKLSGGNDGILGVTGSDYLKALTAFDNDPINLLAIPGVTDVVVANGLQTYAESREDVFVIADVPLGKTIEGARDYRLTEANLSSDRVALYYPWIKVSDPIGVGKNPTKFIPPSGSLMGVYARTDNDRGVWKSPAGTESVVQGALGVEYPVSDAEQDMLNPIGVNVIRAFEGEGIIVWGARTMSLDNKYITTRRLLDYIETSLIKGTRWSVFEPNDENLWGKLNATGETFLRGVWNAGGLRGKSEAEAFFFRCDSTTMTEDDIDNGRTIAHIGVADQKPSEFIIFKVSLR